MPTVAKYTPTGNPYIDGMLTGLKWDTGSLTFSFPTQSMFYGSAYGKGEPYNNFEALTTTQQGAVRGVLEMYSSVANITFTEVTETSSTHGDLRYGESDALLNAGSYHPNTTESAGDVWLNNSRNVYETPIKGTYAYHTLLHETGHALGLKHPDMVWGPFGVMPPNVDSCEYSVMSLRAYAGAPSTGYLQSKISYPQTLMMLDIAALQVAYGANYNANSGSTVYKWDPATGQMYVNGAGQGAPAGNKVFLTIWDGGGSDAYDLSNYQTSVRVDLEPGHWTITSAIQLADLGSGHYARGNVANALLYNGNPASLIENAIGGSAADILIGNLANNAFTGGKGNDVLDGAAGSDTAVYSGASANYTLTQNADGSWTIVDMRTGSPDGTDTLRNMELLQFSNSTTVLGAQSPPPPPAPINAVPVIVSATASGTVTEWLDRSTNEVADTPHAVSGTIAYSDANALDTHTVSVAPRGQGYLGTFSLGTNVDTGNGGSIGWSFGVSDRAIDSLNTGQTRIQVYDITVSDGHGGTVTQAVTITIEGTADATTT